jgi:hypothetical protein
MHKSTIADVFLDTGAPGARGAPGAASFSSVLGSEEVTERNEASSRVEVFQPCHGRVVGFGGTTDDGNDLTITSTNKVLLTLWGETISNRPSSQIWLETGEIEVFTVPLTSGSEAFICPQESIGSFFGG